MDRETGPSATRLRSLQVDSGVATQISFGVRRRCQQQSGCNNRFALRGNVKKQSPVAVVPAAKVVVVGDYRRQQKIQRYSTVSRTSNNIVDVVGVARCFQNNRSCLGHAGICCDQSFRGVRGSTNGRGV